MNSAAIAGRIIAPRKTMKPGVTRKGSTGSRSASVSKGLGVDGRSFVDMIVVASGCLCFEGRSTAVHTPAGHEQDAAQNDRSEDQSVREEQRLRADRRAHGAIE